MSPQGQSVLVQISLQIRVITIFFKVFYCVFFKGSSPGHLQNEMLCVWVALFIFLASHLPIIPTNCDSSIYSRSCDVRSTIKC